ncbi:hypothetical protein [Micromonospora orduensis]|uniref:hypothetical protein n=1 Tax=Micromonospora orduensis TaxID=1420891 RepID=UPI0033E3BB4F
MTDNDITLAAEQDWYFTFGSGQEHDGKYVVIHGTYDSARDEMLEHFGNRWSFQYPSADSAGVAEFSMVELPRAEWPVTLTPEQLTANLLLAVENVIAAGHLDWDSGLDVDGIQSRAHAALVEAYQAVTR